MVVYDKIYLLGGIIMAGLGFFKAMARANSKNLAGWVEGPAAQVKKGKRQVLLEDGKVICFLSGMDDIVITKNDVESVECVAQNLNERYGNKVVVCNSYAVTLKNGEYGTFTIFAGKAAEFTILMK